VRSELREFKDFGRSAIGSYFVRFAMILPLAHFASNNGRQDRLIAGAVRVLRVWCKFAVS
jgi:hypothetical protein